MDQKNMDLLVKTIADRVRARLGDGAIGSCVASPEECAACGGCVIKREGDTRSILTMGATRIAAGPSVGPVPGDMARYIDHTLLKPEATREQLQKLCEEARQ